MSLSMFGRPANSSSTPTLGTPQQRSQATAMKQVQASNRQRQIYTVLAGGVSNRLLLSLRSGLPKEIDYALDLFLQYSYTDAASIPLDVLPGLPAALLDIVRPTPARDSETLRRRTEAALVLRNFILEGGQRCIESVRPYVDLMYEVLVQVIESDSESSTELVLYMLDMAEVYASTCTLLLPPTIETPISRQIPAQKLYTLLAHLTQSNDRALVIGAFTLLGGLAMNRNNNPIFAYRATLPGMNEPLPSCPSNILLNRAISLLPLNDADILLPILEFLYQHTLIPSNSAWMIQSQNMRQIVKLVVAHLNEGAQEEETEYDIISKDDNAANSTNPAQNYRGKAMREALIAAYPSLDNKATPKASTPSGPEPPEPIMSAEDLQAILYMPEPQRAYEWMKTVFEADPAGEITQVSLWKAYQKQFESYDHLIKSGSIPPMMVAADVIKGTQEAFPTASPKHIEDTSGKRFIISGIKIRTPPPISNSAALLAKEREIWKCKWEGCFLSRSPSTLDNAQALYEHLENNHIDASDGPQTCRFDGCGQTYNTPKQLRFHLRTHIPSKSPISPSAPVTSAHAADALDRLQTSFTLSHQIPQTVSDGYAAGVGFVSSLVIRNWSRAICKTAQQYRRKTGIACNSNLDGRSTKGLTGMDKEKNAALDSEDDDIERRKMFGFLTGSTTDDNPEEKDKSSALKGGELDVLFTEDQIKNAVNALANVEIDILAVNAGNKALANYLTETLLCIEDAKRAIDGLL